MRILIAYDNSRNAKLALQRTIDMFKPLQPLIMLIGDIRQRLYVKAVAPSGLAQQSDVAAALVAKTEVLAHQQQAGVHTGYQQSFNKSCGRHFSEPSVEPLHHDLFNAAVR